MSSNQRHKRETGGQSIANSIFQDLKRSEQSHDGQGEEKALAFFQSKYGKTTKFSRSMDYQDFVDILHFFIEKKLLRPGAQLVSLPVFCCLRILLRDPANIALFLKANGLNGLKQQMDLYITLLAVDLCDSHQEKASVASKVLEQILNILEKILISVSVQDEQDHFLTSQIIPSLSHLLTYHGDLLLLQENLRFILNLIVKKETYFHEFLRAEIIDNLLDLLEFKDLETKQLTLHLMANFLAHFETRQSIGHMINDLVITFTSCLSQTNVKVLEHAIWCLATCADNEDDRKTIRLTGAIPLLLSLLGNNQRFDYSLPSSTTSQRSSAFASDRCSETNCQVDQLNNMRSACCHCLAELSYDYFNGQTIIDQNGIYTLAMLLFPDQENHRERESFHHLQRNVFRVLRYLFALNKNSDQNQYKRLFPTDIFELFISIGSFQRDPEAYKVITAAWNMMNIDELTKIKLGRLQSINPKQEPTRFIQDYAVYECLGSGAFGSVYRVAQRGTTRMYALKEIDNRSLGNDPDRSVGKMINEVNIIRAELQHPNVVNYYEIFALNDKLYIRMELIAGLSLQIHLTLLKDTDQHMTEEQIWRLFVQLVLALRYLHKEKRIVHRDFTANNIMLDDDYRVKLTDFGLSKLRNDAFSQMKSFVGTLNYACPEIIQHMPYNDKADIWSLGCVLYQMAVLVPPFFTSNIFELAKNICASDYDRKPLDRYSTRVGQIVSKCLTTDPLHRPDIYGVACLCTEQLMFYTDRVCTTLKTLEKRLRQRHAPRDSQSSRTYPRCSSCSSAKESFVSQSNGLIDGQFEEASQNPQRSESISNISDGDLLEQLNHSTSSPGQMNTKINPNRRPSRVSNASETALVAVPSPGSSSVSVESGYGSHLLNQSIHHSWSASNIERGSSLTGRSRQSSVTGPISILNTRVRPTDRVSQLLEIVHKLIYISYIPSTPVTHKYRRIIDRYRTYLFSKNSSQHLKSELFNLFNHSNDPIVFETNTGRTPLIAALSPSSGSSSTIDLILPEADGSITYEQMMIYIDQILKESDYSREALSSNECLPLTPFGRAQRPPSGKK